MNLKAFFDLHSIHCRRVDDHHSLESEKRRFILDVFLLRRKRGGFFIQISESLLATIKSFRKQEKYIRNGRFCNNHPHESIEISHMFKVQCLNMCVSLVIRQSN